jgi:branched-chain amino acid transport system substrate-binding protein
MKIADKAIGGDPMTKSRITRRGAIKASLMTAALAGTASFFGPWKHNRVWAQGAKKPIKLGLTCDASGQYGNSGQDDLRGMRMAIDEFNAKGGVLGRKVEWITADTETNPATGTRVAERFIAQELCGFLIGALHSGVANAITQVANKYGTIYMNTNSSAPSEAGENCSRVKFVWDGNGTNFSKAAVASAVQKIGKKKWLLLTNDYVWGHTTSAATKAQVEKAGGRIVDNLLVPQNTRDFTAYLLKVQQIKPDVIATAIGGDDIKALRQQIAELKLEDKAAWINNQQDWPDIWGVPETLFGVFGTTWYTSCRCRACRSSCRAGRRPIRAVADPRAGQRLLQRLHGDARTAARVEQPAPTNNIALIKALEGRKMTAIDRMQNYDAYIDPVTHQVQQTIYLARRNPKPVDNTDLFEILSDDDARAGARRRASLKTCKLKPDADIPTYEQ